MFLDLFWSFGQKQHHYDVYGVCEHELIGHYTCRYSAVALLYWPHVGYCVISFRTRLLEPRCVDVHLFACNCEPQYMYFCIIIKASRIFLYLFIESYIMMWWKMFFFLYLYLTWIGCKTFSSLVFTLIPLNFMIGLFFVYWILEMVSLRTYSENYGLGNICFLTALNSDI